MEKEIEWDEVIIIKRGEKLLIRPSKNMLLSDFFDSIEVDLESDLSYWYNVKRELLLKES